MITAFTGFLAGYMMGARAGQKGFAELVEAWEVIRSSDEFKAMLTAAGDMAAAFISGAARRRNADLAETLASAAEVAMRFVGARSNLRVVS
jgi:hypothetical protein